MLDLAGVLLVSALGSILTALIHSPQRPWKSWISQIKTAAPNFWSLFTPQDEETTNDEKLRDIKDLAECHETAALLDDLVRTDGAGEWPPRANHVHETWPAPLRPYKDIYYEMAPLLPTSNVSLDDNVNRERITNFRARFRKLLDDKVDLAQVQGLLEAAEAGRWDVFPRDTYNAFYCCIAWSRHAYR
jgi:hypothetical protein